MDSIESAKGTNLDVIIVGAGISGINAAYRVQTELPNYSYTILESRGALGGTWDLFRFPGIRSDSDFYTFGFPWRIWTDRRVIADGTSIMKYLKESAEAYGIDRKIQYHHKVISCDWSSAEQRWSLSVDANGSKTVYTTRFIVFCAGYYDFDQALQVTIPGIDNFKGPVVHPQFWPENLDYSKKRVIIIGSGATAVTLVPAIAEKAAKVTMLQRSPTYVMPLPTEDSFGKVISKFLPQKIASILIRWKFLLLPFFFFKFCRAFPNIGRKIIRSEASKLLPKDMPYDPTFNPSYNPWEQRLCICPDGDFFKALRQGNADIVTDHIKTVTEDCILTESGKKLDADIIVTATGLKMQIAGGVDLSVDGKPVIASDKFLWKGIMIQDVPNAAVVIGYTNASWTLGADITAQRVCNLLKYMDRQRISSAKPHAEDPSSIKVVPLLDLSSTYIDRAATILPKGGATAPWKPRASYLSDYWALSYGSQTDGLLFTKIFDQRS